MKVLIVSDSHGLTAELEKLMENYRDEVDFFIHCGDSELEADDRAIHSFVAVRGNCDFDERFPEEIVKKIGDRTLFITHGHRYSVKSNLMGCPIEQKKWVRILPVLVIPINWEQKWLMEHFLLILAVLGFLVEEEKEHM